MLSMRSADTELVYNGLIGWVLEGHYTFFNIYINTRLIGKISSTYKLVLNKIVQFNPNTN